MDSAVEKFVRKHADTFEILAANDRVRRDASARPTRSNAPERTLAAEGGVPRWPLQVKCKYTGHEMPMRLDLLQQHLTSRRYLKARDAAVDLNALPAHIVPSEQHAYALDYAAAA